MDIDMEALGDCALMCVTGARRIAAGEGKAQVYA
jgi:hypothetical protein